MRSFRDKTGQQWDVELTIGIARQTFDLAKPEEISNLLDDPYGRFDLLWKLCESQAKQRGVDVDQFDQLLADEAAMISAHEALLDTIQDFFQRVGKSSLSLLTTKSRQAAKRLEKLATEKVQTIDTQLDQVIQRSMAKMDQEISKAVQQAGS